MNGLRQAFYGVRRAFEIAAVRYAIGGSWASTTHGEPRQTNDIDLIAAFSEPSLNLFLDSLGEGYYYDRETAQQARRAARPFNVIHQKLAFKFDIFTVDDEYGAVELDRRQYVTVGTLDQEPVPVVSAEDIIIAKLRWYRDGGEVSQQQWRDVLGVFRMENRRLDEPYLNEWTRKLGLAHLCRRARQEASGD